MTRARLLPVVVVLLSCSHQNPKNEADWNLESVETIRHQERSGSKIQIVYTEFNSGLLHQLDTSIIVQKYRDTLILEEIQYQLKNGVSTKWRHQINQYDANGNILSEVDSVAGVLRGRRLYYYQDNKVQREEHLSIGPNFGDEMHMADQDTIRSTFIRIYDGSGRPIKLLSISKDELSSALTSTSKYDTSVTHEQFNDKGLVIASFTTSNGDTTATSRSEYDAMGREIASTFISIETGITTSRFQYDGSGNQISSLYVFQDFAELVVTEYDTLNRPVSRKTFTREGHKNKFM